MNVLDSSDKVDFPRRFPVKLWEIHSYSESFCQKPELLHYTVYTTKLTICSRYMSSFFSQFRNLGRNFLKDTKE